MSFKLEIMRTVRIYLILIAMLMCAVDACSAGLAASISLIANPEVLVADGKSVTTISAEIRDSSGNLVPDGTQVSLSTSLGTIESTVSTTAGVARARLTSGTMTGTAIVSAWVTQGGVIGRLKVEFLEPGAEIPRQSFITISSDNYLVFNAAKMTVYASGGTEIFHRGLTIRAGDAHFDVSAGIIKCGRGTANEPISLSRGSKTLQVSVLYYQVGDMKGFAVMEDESGSMKRVSLRAIDLTVGPVEDELPGSLFDFTAPAESPVMVKAGSITVRPRDEIHFRRAEVYVDGKKTISVPLHVVPLGSSGMQTSQYLGWGTNGLRIDLPFYYSLSPTSTGSVHLRRGQQAGWGFYSANSGWSLDMVQDYTNGAGGDGTFVLNRITSGDWGAYWRHSQQFDSGGRIYSYLDFPAHRDLFGMLSLSKPLSSGNFGMNIYANKYEGLSGNISSDLFLQSLPKPLAGGAASYVMLARTSYTGGGGYTDDGLGAGLQMQVFGKPLTLGDRTNLVSSLSFGHDWGGLRSGFTLYGNASLNHRLGKSGQRGNLGLVYTYSRDPGYTGIFGRHRLSANMLYTPSERWAMLFFSTYTLDADLSSTFADISYEFMPTWRLNLLQTLQRFEQYGFSDTEIAIGKTIGEFELMLVWSKSRSRLRLEFSAARF